MTGVEKVIGIEKPNNVLLRWCVKNKLSELFIIIMSYFSLTSIHRSWHWWWASFYNDLYCIPTPPTPRSTSTLFCSSEYCHIFVQFLLYMYIYSRYALKMKSTLSLSLPLFFSVVATIIILPFSGYLLDLVTSRKMSLTKTQPPACRCDYVCEPHIVSIITQTPGAQPTFLGSVLHSFWPKIAQ